MKKAILLPLLIFFVLLVKAYKYDFEQILVRGVENPVDFAISPDGLQMVIIDWPRKEKRLVKVTKRTDTGSNWWPASSVNVINDLTGEDTRICGPSFRFDGKVLYFAANLPDTKGGLDLYQCEIINREIMAPVNLGAPVNTAADENYPSVSGNQRELFFTREEVMKKLEDYQTGAIWKSGINSDHTRWKQPEKINTEINNGGIAWPKVYDDNHTLIYSRVEDNKENWKLYWTKSMTGIHWFLPVKIDTLASKDSETAPSYCKADGFLYYIVSDNGKHPKGQLYRYPLDERFIPDKTIIISGKVSNAVTSEPIAAKVLVSDPIIGDTVFYANADPKSGQWWTLVNAGKSYMYHIWGEAFSHKFHLFDEMATHEHRSLDFALYPEVKVSLNMYDEEELWPLDGKLSILDPNGKNVAAEIHEIYKGKKEIILPIGLLYTLQVDVEHYESNRLQLNLSDLVLFDEFIRDIELKPKKRLLELLVLDEETNDPLSASIELFDERKRLYQPEALEGKAGRYSLVLREGEVYDVEVRGPRGFAFKHELIDLAAHRDLKQKTISLSPLKIKVPIQLNNINFEFNSADLLESSFEELARVIQLLKDNPDIHVEIMAHTDDVGSERYNNVLAEKRAKSVVEYLIINGIESHKLQPKGYGETVPLVPNTSDENRAINRRVEMKILDEQDEIFFIEKRLTE
ncbi:OmpA family protein [Roseimarinus sediminis]|uniref:OmpA family protein n=1 Tax=Roseimarinus sediminis TaxID=1610899 RepID=UPI003D1B6B43